MSEITLGDALETDVPEIVSIMHRAFQEYDGVLDPPSGVHNESAESVRSKMQTGHWLLARQDGMTVGCVWYEKRGGFIYIGRLSVPPEFRGRGIANQLLDAVEARARAVGVLSLQLGVRIVLTRMRQAYERRGYHIIRYETHPGYTEPTYLTMEKALA